MAAASFDSFGDDADRDRVRTDRNHFAKLQCHRYRRWNREILSQGYGAF